VNSPLPKPETTQAQVERLTAEAKLLSDAGKEAQALDVYRNAASLMPGAPWLQNRTAELARKLKQTEIATEHYRRAAAAFVMAGFPKRGIGPLRTAWTLCFGSLPKYAVAFVGVTSELAELQRELGFGSESQHLVETSNDALRDKGCTEFVPVVTLLEEHNRPTRRVEAPREFGDTGIAPESGIKASPAAATDLFARVRATLKY